jgi:hypothetical protein
MIGSLAEKIKSLKAEIGLIFLIIIASSLDSYSKSFFYEFEAYQYEIFHLLAYFIVGILAIVIFEKYKYAVLWGIVLSMFWDVLGVQIFGLRVLSENFYIKNIYRILILTIPIIVLYFLQKRHLLNKLLSVVFISATMISVIRIINIKNDLDLTNNINKEPIPYNSKLNTYLVIFDEYGSDAIIEKEFGYKNLLLSVLDTNMISHHQVKSKYPSTIHVVSSLFANENHKNSKNYFSYFLSLIYNNQFIQRLKNNGISIENNSIFDFTGVGNSTKNTYQVFFRRKILTSNTIFTYLYFKFISGGNETNISENYIKNIKQNLVLHINTPTQDKFFGYYHFMLPHTPYIFDSIGTIVKNSYNYNEKDYINNVKYANTIIKELVDTFLASDKKENSRLIIFGDHKKRNFKMIDFDKIIKKDENFVQFLYYTPSNFKLDSIKEYSLNEAIYDMLRH